ncbi:MAG: hypothetical protein Rhirs2KO_15660 [Rhizobiaceae bacterium]
MPVDPSGGVPIRPGANTQVRSSFAGAEKSLYFIQSGAPSGFLRQDQVIGAFDDRQTSVIDACGNVTCLGKRNDGVAS